MPPADRENEVLDFLNSHNIPLPPKAIYRGLKVERNINFAYRTVQNIVKRLTEQGYLMRCDKDALDEGIVRPLPESDKDRRTYYFLTDEGRERAEAVAGKR